MPVARIGESVSYSDKLKEQAQLINKRRQQNLNVEIAQEEKNRQFRDQQLQTFYDFDVSGMSAEHIKAIGKLQANMANSLDPNSEDHYQNTQQLIADISFLNNAYNVASRHRDQRQSGAQQMVGLMTGEVEANPGEEFVNEGIDGLNNANALWDQGGFSGEINVGGSAGNRSMSGVPLVPNPDGGWMEGQGEVSFFENPLTNDSSPLYRPTIIASAPTLNKMAESAMSDEVLNGTNTEEVANLRWSTMSDSKKQRIAKEEYDKLAMEGETTAFEDLTDKQKKDMGIDDESLRNKYRDKLQEGVDARGNERVDTLFDVQRTTEGLTNLKEKININVSDENFAGTVVAADYAKGLNIEDLKDADGNIVIPIEVTYLEGNVTRKETIEPSNPAYQQFIQAMGEGGINEMFDRSGYAIASEGSANTTDGTEVKNPEGAASPSPQQIEIADLDQQRLDILEGTEGKEGFKAIEERAKALRQESIDSAPDEVGFFKRFSGTESKSDIEARPLTDFMSPAEKLAYNQAQKDLAAIDSQLGRESSQASDGTDDQALQDPEEPATERDLSGLPNISPIARSASDGIAMSEGYSPDLQINVPDTINSGVTIAGLDIGGLNPEGDSIKMDILERYLSSEDFSALKQLVGLRGSEAQKKLKEFQSQGLLQQDGLGLTEQDIIDIPALYVSAVELPRVYNIIPEEDFNSLDPEVANIILDVQFNVHGADTLAVIGEAMKSGDKASWMAVADRYYNPETEATYFGSKAKTEEKLKNGRIARGNINRVKKARKNLLAWIEKTYG